MILALTAVQALAQMPPVNPPVVTLPFARLARYLSLTPQQVADLTRVNAELQRFLSQKQARAAVVRREIAEETRRETVDPLALGLRYAELEAICRESREKERSTMREARALLQRQQLEKLAVLEQAVALLPVAGEAAEMHLLGSEQGDGIVLTMPGARSLPGCLVLAPASRVQGDLVQ